MKNLHLLVVMMFAAATARASDPSVVIVHQGFLLRSDDTALTESTQVKLSFWDKETR